MGRAALCMRAAALLAAAGMFIFLAEGISADNEVAEAVAARVLEPTEVVAEIPEEYDTLFELQWGGGSLYQLKGRLATMGCMANTIWLYDNDKWNVYNQYNIAQDNFIIQQFIQTYSEFIPAGTLWADCYRICEFTKTRPSSEWRWRYPETITQDCLSYEYLREKNFYGEAYSVSRTDQCNNGFDPRIVKHIFPILPIHPDVCIVRQQLNIGNGISAQVIFNTLNSTPVIQIYDGRNVYRNTNERNNILLKSEIHELCHINQVWQWVQSVHLDINASVYYWVNEFEKSSQGKEFINLVGFNQSGSSWELPSNSLHRDIFFKKSHRTLC